MEFHARNDNVLILPDEAESMRGSLYIPASAMKTITRGTVVDVGPGYVLADGTRGKLDLNIGDRVEFYAHPGQPIVELGGVPHLCMREIEVLGTLTGEPVGEMLPPPGEPADTDDAGAPDLRSTADGDIAA